MTCPVCGEGTKVLETRAESDCIRRRRSCMKCRYAFTTIEISKDLLDRITVSQKKGEANGHD